MRIAMRSGHQQGERSGGSQRRNFCRDKNRGNHSVKCMKSEEEGLAYEFHEKRQALLISFVLRGSPEGLDNVRGTSPQPVDESLTRSMMKRER